MKKTLALLLSALMVAMSVPAYAVELDAPEGVDEIPAAEASGVYAEDDLGILLWQADFENADALANNTAATSRADASYVNPDYPVMQKLYLRDGQQGNGLKFSVEKDEEAGIGGNTTSVLKLSCANAATGSTWRMFGMKVAGDYVDMPGTYTCTFDMYCPTKSSGFMHRVYGNGITLDQYMNTPNFTLGGTDKFYTKSFSWTCGTKETFDFLTKDLTDNAKIGAVAKTNMYCWGDNWPFYGGMSANDTAFYIDNVNVYFKAAENLVTFDLSDEDKVISDMFKLQFPLKAVYKAGDLLPVPNMAGTGHEFNGWLCEGEPVTEVNGIMTVKPDLTKLEGFDIGADTATIFNASEEGKTITVSKTAGDVDVANWTVETSNDFVAKYTIDNAAQTVTITTGIVPGIISITATDASETIIRKLDITVVGVKASPFLPGLNMFNGSTKPFGFDDNFNGPMSGFQRNAKEGDNYVIVRESKAPAASAYNSFSINLLQEMGRTYKISFSRKSETTTSSTPAATTWWTSCGPNDADAAFSTTGSASSWSTYTVTKASPRSDRTFGINHKNNGGDKTDGDNIDYYDDFSIIPWYKVTYKELDGTETVEYVDPANATFTPKAIAGTAVDLDSGNLLVYDGWTYEGALSGKADAPVSGAITLNHEDFALIPSYTEQALDETRIMWDSKGTYKITCSDGVVVSDEYGIADIEGNETEEVTIRGLGYNGTLYVNDLVIYLYGNHDYKPGLDVLSGTPDGFDFEMTAAEVQKYFDHSSTVKILEAADAGDGTAVTIVEEGGNRMLKFAKIGDALYPAVRAKLGRQIETTRPFALMAMTKGNSASFWVMSQGSGGTDIVVNGGGPARCSKADGWKGDELHYFWMINNGKTTYTYEKFSGIGIEAGFTGGTELYVDDLSIIPAYKVSYADVDGNVVSSEYILLDEDGYVLYEWAPEPKAGVQYFIGETEISKDAPYVLEYKDFTVTVIGDASAITFGTGSIKPEDETFIVPTPEELDITIDHFVTWLDKDGNKYNPGTELVTADWIGATFTAFAQDATKPAMAFAFEFDNGSKDITGKAGLTFGKTKLTEARDGIGYVVNTASGTGNGDARIQTPVVTAKSAAEYYLFVVREKVDVPSLDGFTNMASGLYFIPAGGSYSCDHVGGCNGYHSAGTDGFKPGIEWQTKVIDLKKLTATNFGGHAFGNTTIEPWDLNQLWFDIGNRVPTAAEEEFWQFDYLRLYRGGITTVTYMDGDNELFVDEGRGVGTGYVLRSGYEAPEKDGLVFVGWADEDGNVYEGNVVDLKADLVVYATYAEDTFNKVPTMDTAKFSLRAADSKTNNQIGLRFRANISEDDKAELYEYGFIVTTGNKLGANSTDDLVLGGDIKYVTGTAYRKGSVDNVYSADDGIDTITAVVYGMKAGMYDVDVIARTYACYNFGGKFVTVYGEAAAQNVKAQAEATVNAATTNESAAAFYEANKTAIDEIIANTAA